MKSTKTVRALVESAMMVALATVLSLLKIIEMPYGGSVTVGSMLPMIILAYRYGLGWGFGSGLVYAALQQLLGLSTLSYVTGWQSVLAVVMLDYIVAFAVVGLGGIFRKLVRSQRTALALGGALVSFLRYVCHVISGCTVWAGLSIPSSAAFIYSLSYNITYMLPEAIILIALSYYLGGMIDFSKDTPTRTVSPATSEGDGALVFLAGLSYLLGGIVDVSLIAPMLQDPDSGEFTFAYIGEVEWLAVIIVTSLAVILGTALLIYVKKFKTKKG
jgi:thiamine transporter